MLNQIVIVGRLNNKPTNKTLENGSKVANIELAVPRTFKNESGEYDTDFITFKVFGNMSDSVCEYCKKGDVIGIKGRVENLTDKMELVAEKVTFLSSKKEDKKESEEYI